MDLESDMLRAQEFKVQAFSLSKKRFACWNTFLEDQLKDFFHYHIAGISISRSHLADKEAW